MHDISGEYISLPSILTVSFFYYLNALVVSLLVLHFMDHRYRRTYSKKAVYYGTFGLISVLSFAMNMANFSVLSFVAWEIQTLLAVRFLYHDDRKSPLRRMAECACLLVYLGICETAASVAMWAYFQPRHTYTPMALQVVVVSVVSRIMLLVMYFLVLLPLLRRLDGVTWQKPHLLHLVVLLYTLLNMVIIFHITLKAELDTLCLVNTGCIVLADIYVLYFVKSDEEKKRYANQVRELEQQAALQYEYYLAQSRKQEQTMRILHDVSRHIRAIEELHTAEQHNTAGEYAAQIGELLKPLIPVSYTDNFILNILLSDKETLMQEKRITPRIQIDPVSLAFIRPIDVTTIFGNLLDNAVEAAEQVPGERFVSVKISSYHRMTVVRIENSSPDVLWKNGRPLSQKGKGHGLGLLNVQNTVGKYEGDLKLHQEDGRFVAEIFLNG